MFLCLILALDTWAGTVRFAPLPVTDEKDLRTQYLPMLEYLSAKTGDQYQWVFIPKYPDLINAMLTGQVDLAVMGPLPYVMLSNRSNAFEPLVQILENDGKTTYDCVMLAFGEDRKLKLGDIRNKKIGLTQPESTCGYLAVAYMLKHAGRAPNRDGNTYEYAGTHSKAALRVAQGRYDVAGLKRSQAEPYLGLDLHVIAETGPYPAFALIANTRTLTPTRRSAIRDALLRVSESTLSTWSPFLRNGLEPAHDDVYNHVRKQLSTIGEIPAQP